MTNFTNTLYYGDNLKILRKYIPDESVDLIYLDPPFNSKRAYNVIFKNKTGEDASAQIQAFEDTWSWTYDVGEEFRAIMLLPDYPKELKDMMKAFKGFMDENNLMAYLTMMAVRLVEMHRVLKNTGSIYLHCDPTASHYLKILMDQIFGVKNFQNEIIWQRSTTVGSSKAIAKRHPTLHDIILVYAKSDNFIFNKTYIPPSEKYKKRFKNKDEYGYFYWNTLATYSEETYKKLEKEGKLRWTKGAKYPQYKTYLHELKGNVISDIWTDVNMLNPMAKERLGYPTQKPVALLKRIIQASSNEGDVVLDPFCGCGTAVVAAEKLGRKWIGIDITHLAVTLMKKRLRDNFHLIPYEDYDVIGEPKSVAAAIELAEHSKSQFEFWAVSLVGGQPYKSKGGGDTDIDGFLNFMDYEGDYHRIIIEVKGGGYQPKDVRSLHDVMQRESAPMGILIALKKPTKGMLSYAASLGTWQMPGSFRKYPVLQIFTIEEHFDKRKPDLPDTSMTLKKAKREIRESEKPQKLDL